MYRELMYLHLATVIPCVFLGAALFAMRKGEPIHRKLGAVYMVLMLFTAAITLFMPALVGPRLFNHFGFIHLFSFLTLYTVPSSFISIRKGEIRDHEIGMILLYCGAIILAGGFTLMPGRYLHNLLFG